MVRKHSGHSSLHGSISLVDHNHMLFCMLLKLYKKWFSTIERIANHTNVRYASYNISIIMMIVLGERQKLGDFLGGGVAQVSRLIFY